MSLHAKTFSPLALAGLVLLALSAAASPIEKPGWKLTFDDEFDTPTLNLEKWTPRDPWERERNQELQAYVPDAFTITNGILQIKAEKRPAFYAGKQRDYTSGMMTTIGKFSQLYGRFEIRCRIPAGQGFWPAFWLLPDSRAWPPEIDILEFLGHEPTKLHMTEHFRNEQHQHKSAGGTWIGPDFSRDFHEIAVEWTPEYITWFVDGVQRCHADNHIPPVKMYILVNLAVGGDWPKSPDDTTKFPAAFEVDYVRAYEKIP